MFYSHLVKKPEKYAVKAENHIKITKISISVLVIFWIIFHFLYFLQPKFLFDNQQLNENANNITNTNNIKNIQNTESLQNAENKQNTDINQNVQSTQNNLQCLPNGWTVNGSKLFWKYYYYPEYPSLQDIFEDNGDLVVILSTFLIKTHREYKQRMIKYHQSKWALYLHEDNQTCNQNIVINPKNPIIATPDMDKKRFIIKIRFTLPKKYQNKYNFATIQILFNDEELNKIGKKTFYRPLDKKEPLYSPKFYEAQKEFQGGANWTKIFMKPHKSESNKDDLSYRNVPFCAIKDKFSFYVNPKPLNLKWKSKEQKIYISPNGQQKDFLRICTQNLIFDDKKKNENLVRWMLYHIEQGFSKPIIYMNKMVKSESTSVSHFKKIIDLGLAEMIYYVFPYAFFFHEQPAQEISCNERNRGRTVWLAHNDVDELFYHHENGKGDTTSNITISELLKKYTTVDNFNQISGLKCPNLWMERLKDDKTYADSIQKYNQRTKGITFPENVEFYYVHSVAKGKKMIKPTDISNGHFKNVTLIKQKFKQKIFYPRLTEINKRLTKEIKEYLV